MIGAVEAILTTSAGSALGFVAGLLFAGPVGAVVGAFFGGLNGLAAGVRGIYDWRRPKGWFAFVLDSTWGLGMTSLGVLLGCGNIFKRSATHARDMSRRQNRHIYDGGFALQRGMALTMGNVISNANPSGHGFNPTFLSRHEELHIWQARIFGPFFPLVYLFWGAGGTLVGFLVWLRHRDQSLPDLIRTAAYFDNPFEYWAYRNDRYWPPVGAHPLLAWGPKASADTAGNP